MNEEFLAQIVAAVICSWMIILFLLAIFRGIFLWFFRINESIDLLKSIDKHLVEQSAQTEALQRTAADSYRSNQAALERLEKVLDKLTSTPGWVP